MKKKLKSVLALALCLCLCMSILSGCGGSAEETTAATKAQEVVKPTKPAKPQPTTAPTETEAQPEAINAYFDNDEAEMTLSFFDDFTFVSSNEEYQSEGTYFILGNLFTLEMDGDTVDGVLGEDGKLVFENDIGYYYEVEVPGYVPEGGAGEDDYLDSCYDNNESECSLQFFPDMKVLLTDHSSRQEGVYTLTDGELFLDFGGYSMSGYVTYDDEIEIYGIDGTFYYTISAAYIPYDQPPVAPVGLDDFEIPTGDYKTTAYTNDGKLCYSDYDGKVSITYPDQMTNYEDILGPGSVLLCDDMAGFVFGLNVTEEFLAYDGTREMLADDLFSNGILSVYNLLYGYYDEYDELYIVPPEQETAPGRVISCETVVSNEDFEIRVIFILYENMSDGVGNGEFTLKAFFFPDGNDDQIDFLWNEVTRCISLP